MKREVRNDFSRLAVVNRGEAAMRLIHGVREYNGTLGTDIRTIALYTDPDERAMFTREADEVVALGPATFVDERDGQRKVSYLDLDRLEQALVGCRADAAWVGWGLVAEKPEFVDLCDRLGITFLGPPASVMRNLGDKITSKLLAEKMDVPVSPWSGGPVESVEAAREQIDRLGLPLVIKATSGGGGRGIRVVRTAGELEEAFRSARAEAALAFGDPTVFVEQMVAGARHVEVQVVGDAYGTVWALGVRDCTVQRRNQKVLEEAPSPVLSKVEHDLVLGAAHRLAAEAGYEGAGTVEFLYETATKRFAFMEVNARLQVEHPVTELTTGVDLIGLQLHVARGGRLEGDPPPTVGHAIEARLNAENPDDGFTPSPGRVELFRPPLGPGIRVDTGIAEGDEIAPEFDSMVAKIIAWGPDRDTAMARLRRGLEDTTVVIRGGGANRAFLLHLLRQPEVRTSQLDNKWLDVLAATGDHVPRSYADVALLAAAIEAQDGELAVELSRFRAAAARGRPEARRDEGWPVTLRLRGEEYRLVVYRLGPRRYRVVGEGCRVDVDVDQLGRLERRLACFGRTFRVVSIGDRLGNLVEVDDVPHRVARDAGGVVRSPTPALVVAMLVQPGDEVSVGDALAVIEAMKMETTVRSPVSGRVKSLEASENAQVQSGAPLVVIEPSDTEATVSGERVVMGASGGSDGDGGAATTDGALEAFRRDLLGFDLDPVEAERLGGAELRRAAGTAGGPPELLQTELHLLELFADVASLTRRRPESHDLAGEEQQSPEEYLFTYLRFPERGVEGLPQWFGQSVERAIAHHGVTSLDPTPELSQALYWLFRSQQRMAGHVPGVMAILDRWLEHADALVPHADDNVRRVLDRIVYACEHRHDAVADLAREVRYRWFEQEAFEAARRSLYDRMIDELTALESQPVGASAERRVRTLVECPQPLNNLLTSRFAAVSVEQRRAMLEVMTRRYYRIRDLAEVETLERDGWAVATGVYESDRVAYRVLSTFTAYDQVDRALDVLRSVAESRPGDRALVLDVYAWRPGHQPDAATTAAELDRVVARNAPPARLHRVVVAVTGPGQGFGMSSTQHLTFRPTGDGLAEDRRFRGLHPMMAKRLGLWRLSNFDIERLDSVEDVYLFRAVARENPRDERLVALAEVRDLTAVRDESGRILSLPNFERMLIEALASIRLYRSHMPEDRRPEWNRVLLYVWPVLDLAAQEIQDVVHRLASATEGLGMHKVDVLARLPDPSGGPPLERVLSMSNPVGGGVVLRIDTPVARPISALGEYELKVALMRRRGLVYPYEIVRMLSPPADGARADFPPGDFTEHDLDVDGRLVPVDRPWGQNTANIVVGVIRSFTAKQPEGMSRVIVIGDPSKNLGSLAEPECRRIIGAIDLAERLALPVEWFALSSGARISMTSGVENMDWIARVLRRIVTFTERGGEINVVVSGINVGAQPYWNAEATMLMHTRGILVMTPQSAMVLTGKQALDYSGGVSAEDNFGIGGYDRVMGPNGQAQYWVAGLAEAGQLLLRHYDHTYVAPGERFPRRRSTDDERDRDVGSHPHPGEEFQTLGGVFSEITNPGRKKPFDIRTVLRAVIDADCEPLERWAGMSGAETAVVWDGHLGGSPVCLIGFESHPLQRRSFVPADGPDQWTSGTLFPLSSKKVARALNAASGNRPVVVLANLSGFDGSPESMRNLQLEYGAEIGRAVVNFDGPLVFCVISRYHGGAFVVFSNTLNDSLEVAALEGAHASVIGGAPAAAVVFAVEVETRTDDDPRVKGLEAEVEAASGVRRAELRARLTEFRSSVRAEKLGEVADEFDAVHSVQRAQKVGAVHRILPPTELRPYLIDAVERGMARHRGVDVAFPAPD